MAGQPLSAIVRRLRVLAAMSSHTDASDQELLERYMRQRDQTAFAALVQRHGPMVRAVCRRLVGQAADADDAFQATFLVLLQRAQCIRKCQSLGSWLHGVAYRVAMRTKNQQARRCRASDLAKREPVADAALEAARRELCALLDQEVQRLPEKCRAPVVLCYLESRTRDEAARQLGWSLRTLDRRLARGRELLRTRLLRCGVTMPATLLIAGLSEEGAQAVVPAVLMKSTVEVATAFGAGGAVSAPVAALAGAFLRSMAIAKAKAVAVLVLIAGLAGVGTAMLTQLPSGEKQHVSEPGSRQDAIQAESIKTADAKQPRVDRYGDPLPAGVVARLGTVRWRHEGRIAGLIFSPDSKTLASSGLDVILWDVDTGRVRRHLPVAAKGHWGSGLHFSADGKTLTVAGLNDEMSVWDAASGRRLRTVALPKLRWPVMSICFSPDGKILAEVEMELDRVSLVDVATGKELKRVGGHRAGVYGLAFSPDSSILALGTLGPSVQLWDVTNGKLIRGIDHHGRQFVHALAFSPDGKTIASGSSNVIILSDVASGKELGRLEMKMYPAASLAFTPDGKTLLSVGDGRGEVNAWDVQTRKLRATWPGRFGSGQLALSPNGKIVALGTECSTISLWDVESGKEMFTEFDGHDTAVNCLAFTPDGKALVSAGNKQQLRFWDAKTWQPLRELKESSRSLSFTPDGKRLALVPAYQRVVRVKDLADGKNDLQIPVSEGAHAWRASFVDAGKRLVTLESSPSHTTAGLLTWDTASGRQVGKLLLSGAVPAALAVTGDGRTAFVGDNEGRIHYCRLGAGKEIATMPGHAREVGALSLSPDEWLLISGSGDRAVRVWERVSGKEICTLRAHKRAVTAVAFSPSGRVVASADGGQLTNPYPVDEPCRIQLWDVATGKELAHFQGHDSDVDSMTFSADGKTLVCGLGNSTILIWEVPRELQDLTLHAEGATERDLQRRWTDLAANAASEARRAVWDLAATPEETVRFLRARLRPARLVDSKQLERWILDLESERFEARERATQELIRSGVLVEAALRAVLDKRPGLETRRRVEQILEKIRGPITSRETLQSVRAVEVLERVGTPVAQNVLKAIATGAPEAFVTQEAKASMARLARRRVPAP